MPLTLRTNGSGSQNIVSASWWNDYYNLLTGSMSDQEVTLKNNLVLQAIGAAPATALSGALASGTALGVGAYTYTYTFVSPDGESTESPTFAITTTTGNQAVNLSSIGTGPTGTTARNLYRTAVGGSQRKFLHQIADNSTTTYADTTPDSSLGANAPTSPSFGGSLVIKDENGNVKFRIFNDGTFSSGSGSSLGNTTISGTLTVSGATTLQSTLAVSGTSSLDSANITTNGSGKLTLVQLAVSSTSTMSGKLTISAGGLAVTGGTSSLDNGKVTTDGNGNLTLSGGLTFGGALKGTASGSVLNGSSSGTATLYAVETGAWKRVIIELNNFWNNSGGAAQTIALPVTFSTVCYVRTGSLYQIELRQGSTIQNLLVFTGLASGGGTTSSQNYIAAYSFGVLEGAVADTIGFRYGGSGARTSVIILEGY
jgi:hypothetical protein